jgi:histidine triad (HIT) family protein
MKEETIFTKIIKGEIPSYKVYEDEKTFAFLDIFPKAKGHVLVVPKAQVDKFYDLSDEDYEALFATVKKVARRLEEVFGTRTLVKIIGTDVPHAHVHLFPFDPGYIGGREPERASDEELAGIAEKIRF